MKCPKCGKVLMKTNDGSYICDFDCKYIFNPCKKEKKMVIKPKFNIGDKFRFNNEHRTVTCTTEKDIFRIDSIVINKHGIYYSYYKFPANKNRSWNRKFGYRSHVAEFAIEKVDD